MSQWFVVRDNVLYALTDLLSLDKTTILKDIISYDISILGFLTPISADIYMYITKLYHKILYVTKTPQGEPEPRLSWNPSFPLPSRTPCQSPSSKT